MAWNRGRERRRDASIISSGRFTPVSTSLLPLRGEQINDLEKKHHECSSAIYHCFEISNSCNLKSLMMSLNRAEGRSLNELLSLCGSLVAVWENACLAGVNCESRALGCCKLGACTSDSRDEDGNCAFHGRN